MTGLSLETMAAIAEIVGMITVLTGLIFGMVQIRAHRTNQRSVVATSLA